LLNLQIPGTYIFRLTANWGGIGSDEVVIRVLDTKGRTWTRNADFEEGQLNNVQYDTIPDALTFAASGTTTSPRLSAVISLEDHGNDNFLARIDSDTGEVIGWHAIGASSEPGGPPYLLAEGMIDTSS